MGTESVELLFMICALTYVQVPTLVPKPGSPAVTQDYLPCYESTAKRYVGLRRVTLDCDTCSLDIHGGCWAELSRSDVLPEFPRVGG